MRTTQFYKEQGKNFEQKPIAVALSAVAPAYVAVVSFSAVLFATLLLRLYL